MRAKFTDKFIECVLDEITEIEKGNNTKTELWRRVSFWDKSKSEMIKTLKSNIQIGYISSLVFSLRDNGNWICDTIPHYSFHGSSNPEWFFENGFVEIIKE